MESNPGDEEAIEVTFPAVVMPTGTLQSLVAVSTLLLSFATIAAATGNLNFLMRDMVVATPIVLILSESN